MYTIDFETEAIIPGSPRTPKPVGLAIKHNSKPAQYLSWGHLNIDDTLQDANKHIERNAKFALHDIFLSEEDILCHNAKFDIRVAVEHFKLEYPNPLRIHDTLFLAFLNDPREKSLELKQLADKYLDLPPEEQDELKEWIVANIKKATEKNYGAFICYAPVKLVKKYAIGDVDRTYKLYRYYKKELMK